MKALYSAFSRGATFESVALGTLHTLAALMAVAIFFTPGCGKKDDPKAAVRAAIRACEEAANQGDVDGVGNCLSSEYADPGLFCLAGGPQCEKRTQKGGQDLCPVGVGLKPRSSPLLGARLPPFTGPLLALFSPLSPRLAPFEPGTWLGTHLAACAGSICALAGGLLGSFAVALCCAVVREACYNDDGVGPQR